MIDFLVIILLIPIDIWIFIKIGKLMFEDLDDFWQCVKHDLTPDLYSLFKGRLFNDWKGEFRLGMFSFACFSIILGELFVFLVFM
ncbi:hypothetical protein [Aquibacillus kalidii]|uniref:hypothetical protein n=1 Tax=Aquibacillus kalidii TaxID=2762597 RepID=UPI001644B46F|nr:hypothetical protein [Aquibacillus kalidii]